MTFNIALERDQEQRVANDAAALEYLIECESISAIKHQGKEDGLSGKFPVDPYSPIYFASWSEGYQKYAIAEKERQFNERWSGIPF